MVTFFVIICANANSTIRKLGYTIACILSSVVVSQLILSDYLPYVAFYKTLSTNVGFLVQAIQSPYEPVYSFLNFIFKHFTQDFNYLRFLIIFFSLVVKFLFLMRWSKYCSIAFLFYISLTFYPDSYLLRSTLACTVLLFAFWALMSGKSIVYFIVPVLIAAGIHLSALVVAPLWFLRNVRLNIFVSLTIFCAIFLISFVNLGHVVVESLLNRLPPDTAIAAKLFMYQDSMFAGSSSPGGVLVLYSLITFAYILLRNQLLKIVPEYHKVLIFMLFTLAILITLNDFTVLAERLHRLTSFFMVVALGQIIICFRKSDRLFISVFLICFFNLVPYWTDAGPYKLIGSL